MYQKLTQGHPNYPLGLSSMKLLPSDDSFPKPMYMKRWTLQKAGIVSPAVFLFTVYKVTKKDVMRHL